MIDLNLAPEQQQIVDSARAMLERHYPVERLRKETIAADDLGPIAEFGGFSLSLPEEAGGGGLTVVEEMLLQVEFGRHLVSPGALALSLALRLCHEANRIELVEQLLAGEKKIALGNALDAHDAFPGDIHLYNGEVADLALVWTPGAAALIDLARVGRRPVASAIPGIALAHARVTDADILVHLDGPGTTVPLLARLLVSAQLLGISEALRDMSVDYAKVRTQFGQPIGAFQAVKHRCADMAIRTEAHSAQLTIAALALSGDWPDAAFQLDAAWLLACRYAMDNARSAIQVHGGIGFSAECDAHLYMLRAQLFENLGAGTSRREADLCRRPAQAWAMP